MATEVMLVPGDCSWSDTGIRVRFGEKDFANVRIEGPEAKLSIQSKVRKNKTPQIDANLDLIAREEVAANGPSKDKIRSTGES